MQSSLAASATKCNELLETLLARVGNEGCRHRSNLELAPIEDQVARFRIWAGNLGAFHKSSSTESLDHRLRDEPKFKDHIYELLQDLNDTLQAVLAIASGERPNRQYESEWEDSESDIESESASQSRVKEEGADQNRNVFDILNRYNEYHGQTLHQSEAEELLVSIKETIGSLFKISNVIREALPRDPYAKALSDKRYHLEEILGIDHVRAQFDLLESEGKNWLVERLGKAITYRQRFLRYAHDHRNNLSTESSENASDPNDAVVTPMQALQLSEPSNQVDEERNDQSPSPFALRVVQSNGSLLRLSPLSDISKGMDKFECPLCWTIQEFEEEALWKEHALFDLRPYVCTFEHCDMKLFSSQRGWFDHELQEHRVSWFCHFCQRDDFEVEDDMRDHLRQRHLLDGKERQIDALAQASRRHEEQIAASSCPFCSDWHKKLRQANPSSEKDGAILVTRTQFREHVGSHMEQLALLTITHGYLEGDGGEETLKQSKTHEGDVLGTSSKSALSREEGDVSVLTDRNNDGTPTENAEREVVDAPVDTQSSLHSTPSRSALASGSVSKSSSSKRPIQELATGTSISNTTGRTESSHSSSSKPSKYRDYYVWSCCNCYASTNSIKLDGWCTNSPCGHQRCVGCPVVDPRTSRECR